MVFQSYALYPHMTVGDNIAFPLKMARLDRATIDSRVSAAAARLNLTDYLHRKPKELSGGQRQRVAIGRAIVREPRGFLFDEPLSNLDAALRVNMRLELCELHAQLKTTMIYVTHDQVEAMTMADKIVVLNKGNIEQVGSPLDLYHRPRNRFVAGFIGSPKMNFLGGKIAAAYGCDTIGIRPEHIDIDRPSQDASAREESLQGCAILSEHLGSDTFIHARLTSGETVTVRQPGNVPVAAGDALLLRPNKAHLHRFDANGVAIGTN
jgi:multiple sugar transport system ATP-binding protein